MARTEARLLTSIWDDDDFIALSPDSQRLYMFVLSQSDLAHDGVIALRERRWARKARGMTVGDIEKALRELDDHDFCVVDEDEEELLLRSFIRRDKVYRQPNILLAAADHLAHVKSPRIRAALAVELRRILAEEDVTERCQETIRGMQATLREHDDAAPIKGSPKGSRNPSANPSGNPSANPSAKGSGQEPGQVGHSFEEPQVETLTGTLRGTHAGRDVNFVPEKGEVLTSLELKDLSSLPAAPPAADKKGTRIPSDFAVTDDMVAWAREKFPSADVALETEKFIDYWVGKAGRDGVKTDWVATWRNWIRNSRPPVGTRGQPTPKPFVDDPDKYHHGDL